MLNKYTNKILQLCGLFLLLLFMGLMTIACVGLMIEGVIVILTNLQKF